MRIKTQMLLPAGTEYHNGMWDLGSNQGNDRAPG